MGTIKETLKYQIGFSTIQTLSGQFGIWTLGAFYLAFKILECVMCSMGYKSKREGVRVHTSSAAEILSG